MNEQLKIKISKRLVFIRDKCFELTILEYQYFLIQMSARITTTDRKKILEERLGNDLSLHEISADSIRDKYFLELAKLFEDAGRNETNSFPNLKLILEKNLDTFPVNLREQICNFLSKTNVRIETYQGQILNLKKHRDKCLGHNDKTAECKHLETISSLDTKALINILIQFTNELSGIFEYEMFDSKKVEEMKDRMSHTTYERIKKMEQS